MNFFYNLIGKGNKQQQSKYDKVTFKISLSDHIPQFYQTSGSKVTIQQQLTQDNPIYFQLFPKNQQKYVLYTVKQNDTIFGLAIKLDINEKSIRDLNDISGNIYPGMQIKLPQGTNLQQLNDQQPVQQNTKLKISQLLISQKVSTINYKYIVYYYVGLSGHIKGTLSINQNYAIFNPLLEDQDNLKKFTIEKLLKFNALVQTVDIAKVQTMKIPMIDQVSNLDVPKYNNVVLFNLYKVGNTKIQKKYKQRLKQLKIEQKAIASVSFSFSENLQDNQKLCQQVSQIMNSIIQRNQQSLEDYEEKKRLTNIPFFDIIHQNIHPREDKFKSQIQNHIIRQSAVLGILNSQSDIITNEHFQNLVKGLPILYKLYNWNKIYSTRKDGSSFNTFLNKAKYVQPVIMFIKQYKGSILGAFIVENLQLGKTGRGQMFIFTFRQNSKKPQIYEWTTKNQFFVYIQKEQGLGIGMGLKYGIFLRNTLDKGSSARTQTFGNTDKLSNKEDFLVDDVQLWGVDNSF